MDIYNLLPMTLAIILQVPSDTKSLCWGPHKWNDWNDLLIKTVTHHKQNLAVQHVVFSPVSGSEVLHLHVHHFQNQC